METVFWFIMDILFFGSQGWLFYRLLTQVLEPEKLTGRQRARTFLVLALPFLCLRMVVTRSMAVQRLFYGGEGYIMNSRQTIISAALSFLVLMLSGLFIYWRRKKLRYVVIYLSLLYAAVSEMLRFGVYCLTVWLPNLGFAIINHSLLETGSLELQDYMLASKGIQIGWNLIFYFGYIICMYLTLGLCIRYLKLPKRLPERAELMHLMVPVLACICLGILLRSLWLNTRDGEPHLIFDDNLAFYGIIPGLIFLSLFLVASSLRMRWRVIEEEEKRGRLLIYQSRVEDMEAYIRDLEGMQEHVKGMKHDMKNYASDIHALLGLWQENGGDSSREELQRELTGYLDSMEQRLDRFQLHYKTGNPVTDVIINRFRQQAQAEDITAECRFSYPEELGINPFDLSVILNNAFSNALEACKRVKEERFISLQGVQRERIFFLEMRNSMGTGQILKREGRFLKSTKGEEEHGLGLKNIASCVEKYGGHMEFGQENGVFFLTILLQEDREHHL